MSKSKVGIIIPEKDNLSYTLKLISSICRNSKYDRNLLTLYIADTGSSDENKESLKSNMANFNELDNINYKIIEYDYYNFAKINNDVIKNHVDPDTDIVILCNNDVELIDDAITNVVEKIENTENVGTVGICLLYPNDTIQHAGMILKVNYGKPAYVTHFLFKKRIDQTLDVECIDTFGNTGAFMATTLKNYLDIGGLNENYDVCYEDVEFNVLCLLTDKNNITLMNTKAYHHESITRGKLVLKSDKQRIMALITKNKISLLKINKKISDKLNNITNGCNFLYVI